MTTPVRPFGMPAIVPGFWDTFDRASGSPVGNGWTDLASALPHYAPALVQDGRLGIGTAGANGLFGIYRQIGLTDGVEVTVRQRRATAGLDGNLDDIGWQPGPAVHVNPAAINNQRGLTLIFDIAVSSLSNPPAIFVGVWAMFDNSDYILNTPDGYILYESNWMQPELLNVGGLNSINSIRFRCVGGKMSGYWNGQRIVGPIDVPSWAVGVDGWGANNICASLPISNIGNVDVVQIRPYSTSLGSYPSVTVGHTGATNKAATASSINVAYPTVIAGELLVLVVATNNGTFTTPTGWTSKGTVTIASGIRGHVFEKVADGTESGNLTIARATGTDNLAGFMFTLDGYNINPVARGVSSQANTSSSTTLALPGVTIAGGNRFVVWIGATAGNVAITVPSGFTQIANCGTSGAAINLAAGWQNFTISPQATSPAMNGTLGSSATSVAMSYKVYPDPR